jgi:hypothetical protein
VAKIWIAGNIVDYGAKWVFLVVEGTVSVGAIIVQAVTPVYAIRTNLSHLYGTHFEEEVGIKGGVIS